MKLARSRTPAGIVPVVEADGRWYDLTPIAVDIDPTAVGYRQRRGRTYGNRRRHR